MMELNSSPYWQVITNELKKEVERLQQIINYDLTLEKQELDNLRIKRNLIQEIMDKPQDLIDMLR